MCFDIPVRCPGGTSLVISVDGLTVGCEECEGDCARCEMGNPKNCHEC